MEIFFEEVATIAAVATPPGRGAIGIIRISGPAAIAIARKLFHGRDPGKMPGFTAAFGELVEGGERLDEVICLVMRGPRSYTGEDVVEFHCHGGPLTLQRVLNAVIRAGARPAQPGEFTRRAFLAGKLDLVQAEAVADLIASETEAAARSALDQLSGRLSQILSRLRQDLLELLALVEAPLDFAEEEDIISLTPAEIMMRLDSLRRTMEKILEDTTTGRRLREGARVVITGRPNVGKSTLMNFFLHRRRVIVTPVPGTTRDVVEDTMEISGLPVRLCDTAGLREVEDEVEKIGVTIARETLQTADLVLLLLDGSADLSRQDRRIALELQRPVIFVVNKCDLPAAINLEEVKELAGSSPLLRISALTGEGVEKLKQIMAGLLGSDKISREPPIMTNVRHQEALQRSLRALGDAAKAVETGLSSEFLAADLRRSLAALGEITGEAAADELLDLIFSRFCIGK